MRLRDIRLFFVITGMIILVNTANAQPYYFRHYQVENGLSNNTVYCTTQDSKGFMWFGTKDGLNRFDGFHFKIFHINNDEVQQELAADYIYSLYPNKDGTLWVGAETGLYIFNNEKERLEPFIDTLHNVYDIQIDRNGAMWFLSNNTVCRYNFKTKLLKQFPPSEFFYASSICISKDGKVWASTTNGFVERFNDTTGKFTGFDVFVHSTVPTSRWIQKIHTGDNNSIFIGTSSQGLKIFNINSCQYQDILTYNPDRTTIFVRDMLQNTENEFWFATESGIFIFNTDTKRFINLKKKFLDPYSLSDNAIYALCKDHEGSIWAGTYFGGLNYYAKQNAAFIKYFPDNAETSVGGNVVREICEDHYDNLWIGTEDGGLNKLNKKTGAVKQFRPSGDKSSIAYSNIHGLWVDGDDLWIGTFEHGIDIMDVRTGNVKKHFTAGPGENELKSNFGLCFLRTSTGKFLIGTSNGLFYYNQQKDNFQRPFQFPDNLFISVVIEDHNKIVWVGTHDRGVFWFDLLTSKCGHLENFQHGNSHANLTINDIIEDSNNNLWFATEGGGLGKFSSNRKTLSWYTTKDGLPGNFIFKVLEDNKKNLWVSTSKGLAGFEPGSSSLIVYTQANGLLNDQFNYHSGYKDADGRLYFGSVKGMISFMPDDFLKRTVAPPVYITGFQVYNNELKVNDSSALKKSIIYTSKITLPYYQSSVSIDFAALSYISPEMTAYNYQLEGLDNNWTNIKTNRKVYFTNLSPGTYVFKLKAAVNGNQGKNETHLVIEIMPPFWKTRGAYLFYGIVVFLLLYYLLSNYHKRQQNKKEKEIYESKIEFFTNVVHEIKTPLTLIKGPVENILEKQYEMPGIKEDIACLDRNTNRLMNLVSQILDFRQIEIKGFSLYFTKVNVNEILRETWLSFKILAKKRNLDYQLLLPSYEVYTFADAEALRKIFSNLISNGIKYADKNVKIRLFPLVKSNDIFTIEFENDGYIIPRELEEKIFEPFYRLKETSAQKGTGIGLTLARSLAELHKGVLQMKFNRKEINIFELTLPFKPEQINKPENIVPAPLI